ncbi:hypothetical protein DE146DRAFT_14042 [Phaeosphaeria sp. MPI-PUGE-AT-0046c]|nr:hypothetical protein DE146DRAFT_14042 [Phaeosphaeria sp. MPI-PUGE-AT-0046c]
MSNKGETSTHKQPQQPLAYEGVPQDNDGPPGYSEASQAQPLPEPITAGVYDFDISQYLLPNSVTSKDGSTVTISNVNLCSDSTALVHFINAQAALPPRPEIRITGVHNSLGEMKTDFDVRVNLMRYLLRKPRENPLNYVKMVEPKEVAWRGDSTVGTMPHAEGGLSEWAHMFCSDQSPNKAFILERQVINWNTPFLEGRVRSLVASLKYRGNITVSFPVSHTAVVVTPDSQGAGFVTKLFSKVSDKKKYSVVRAVWPYASMASSSLAAAVESQGGPRRVCAVQSEEGWWESWSSVVAAAIAEKRQGWVTVDDLLDEAMFGSKSEGKAAKDWGANSW